jgi:hypothetical protein
VLSDLQIEKASVDGERRKVEADLGPVKYLATLIGAADQDVLRIFILVVALLLDPAAVLLLLAAARRDQPPPRCRPGSYWNAWDWVRDRDHVVGCAVNEQARRGHRRCRLFARHSTPADGSRRNLHGFPAYICAAAASARLWLISDEQSAI